MLQGNYAISYAPNSSNKYTYDLLTGDTRRQNDTLSNVFDNYYLNQSGGLTYRHITPEVPGQCGPGRAVLGAVQRRAVSASRPSGATTS